MPIIFLIIYFFFVCGYKNGIVEYKILFQMFIKYAGAGGDHWDTENNGTVRITYMFECI